jgi:hypothetical protein
MFAFPADGQVENDKQTTRKGGTSWLYALSVGLLRQ